MTAPDRPAVTEEEIVEAAGAYAAQFCLKPTGLVAQDFTAGARFALAACFSQSKRVAVEAKIEALEEMVPLVCPDCAAGAPDDGSFNHWEGRQVSEDDWEQEQYECRASAIREKIAALRKELGE